MKSKQEIKKNFENGDIPNQDQFWEWQDSYWHKDEKIPSDKIDIDLSKKADLVGGTVPAAQLPSYVDDVLEFTSLANLPQSGEVGKIYITTDTNKLYRWTGTRYVDISQGDVGTLQSVTERGNETTENLKIQGIYFGGLGNAENIIIGDESSFVNNHAGGTIAIGKGAKPEGIDHIAIGNNALAINDNSSMGNTVIGHFAMSDSKNSSENTVLGYNTFSNATNSFANAIYGNYAGQFSGDSLTQNTIFGYSSGCRLGAHSTNNIIIGAQSAFGGAVLTNKLYIHSSQSTPPKRVSDALISGDFEDRYININGKFSITPGQIPSANSNYTKNIVAQPDGTFGWEDKIAYIPLKGTEDSKPVIGEILIKNTAGYTRLSAGYVYASDTSDRGAIMTSTSVKFVEENQGVADLSKTGIATQEGEFTITCYKPNARGLTGHFDYTENIEDFDYVQKIYINKKLSNSEKEEVTGGTWVNGKPIYKKTVVFTSIPTNGEIDLQPHFKDIEVITSNQMFTEWKAMDASFAGNQWKAETFITLQPNMVKIQSIKMSNYDYSLINSFALTLEYTKTTD